MNNYCKPSPATWLNENKKPKLLQAKSSNFTYNCFCYKIRNFNEKVVFVTKNEPSPATWPNENKEQKVLQVKSSNLTYNRFCYKIRSFDENVVFVTNNEPSPATWPHEKKDEQLLQAKSSILTQWKQKDQNYCRQSPATLPTIVFVTKLETLMKMLFLLPKMSQVQQLDPMKTKNKKVLQAKSSNLTYNRFCYKIRNFNENVVFVTNNEPSPATWPNEKKDEQLLQAKSSNLTQWKQKTKITAGKVQQLYLQLLLLQN